MKVRMLRFAAGPKGVLKPGMVVEVQGETAVAWLRDGAAEAVPAEPETAEAPAVEAAVVKTRKRRTRED